MRRNLAVFVWALFLLPAVRLHGQGSAVAVPKSDRVVTFSLTLPTDENEYGRRGQTREEKDLEKNLARVSVRDGTMITIENEDKGYIYAFAVSVDQGDQTTLMPLEITNLNEGGQSIKQIGEDLYASFPLNLELGKESFGFQVEEFETWDFPNLRPLDPKKAKPRPLDMVKIFGKSGGGSCCVSCGSFTICATSVDMYCGSCDSAAGKEPRIN